MLAELSISMISCVKILINTYTYIYIYYIILFVSTASNGNNFVIIMMVLFHFLCYNVKPKIQ